MGLFSMGLIKIPADGIYSFYISSDDGSKLFIDDKILVDNDGLHGIVEKVTRSLLQKAIMLSRFCF